MLKKIVASVFCLIFVVPCAGLADEVRRLRVTVLSTMLDGRKFLFDTGANRDLVLKNAESLGMNFSDPRTW